MPRHRRKSLPPPTPPTYITLAEAKQRGLRVPYDMLAPADKQRLAARAMAVYDALPSLIRAAVGRSLDPDNALALAVNLLDKGQDCAQIIKAIECLAVPTVLSPDTTRLPSVPV